MTTIVTPPKPKSPLPVEPQKPTVKVPKVTPVRFYHNPILWAFLFFVLFYVFLTATGLDSFTINDIRGIDTHVATPATPS